MILLLGSTGYVGNLFKQLLNSESVAWTSVSERRFCFSGKTELIKDLKDLKVSFVINCAGYTGKPNVDACELDKGNCLDGNAILPAVIRDVCGELGIGWGHVSSGCIFSGERPDGADGGKKTPRISLFDVHLASFTAEPKHWERKFLAGRKQIVERIGRRGITSRSRRDSYGDFGYHSTKLTGLEIFSQNCSGTKTYCKRVILSAS